MQLTNIRKCNLACWISSLFFSAFENVNYLSRTFFPIVVGFLSFYQKSERFCPFDLNHAAHLFALLEGVVTFGNKNADECKSEKFHSHWDLVKACIDFVYTYVQKMLAKLKSNEMQNQVRIHLKKVVNNQVNYCCMECN